MPTRWKFHVGQKVRFTAPSWMAGRAGVILDCYSTHGGVVPQYHVKLARRPPRNPRAKSDVPQMVYVAYDEWLKARD